MANYGNRPRASFINRMPTPTLDGDLLAHEEDIPDGDGVDQRAPDELHIAGTIVRDRTLWQPWRETDPHGHPEFVTGRSSLWVLRPRRI